MNTLRLHMDPRTQNSIAIFLVWLFHVSAVIGIFLSGTTEWFISKTPLNLLLCFALLAWVFPLNTTKKISLFAIFFLTGMIAEIIGVQTGILFGDYIYGENLGVKFLGVPFMIGVNWALLTFISGSMAGKWFSSLPVRVLTGVSLMLALDFFMEGVAPEFDFWEFSGGEAPFYNYICWGGLALLMQAAYHYYDISGNYRFSAHLYLAQLLFFLTFFIWKV